MTDTAVTKPKVSGRSLARAAGVHPSTMLARLRRGWSADRLMAPAADLTWPQERIERLRALWLAGCSAGEVGRTLRISKNSVIGMVHRLGIATDRPTRVALPNPMSGKPAASARWAAARAKMESIKTAAVKSAIAEGPKIGKPPSLPKLIIDDIPLGQRLGLLDLPFSGRCKWPCGDPGKTDFFFCGAVVRAGAQWPYCEMHHERSVSPALWKPAKEPTT